MENDPLAPPPAPAVPTAPATPAPTPMGDLPPAPPAATQSLTTPPPPPVAPATATAPEVTQASVGSKKPMMIALIIALVIAILGVGGFYAYTTMGAPKKNEPTEKTTETPDTSSAEIQKLNTEVEDIDVADPDTTLTEVDKEISALDATPAASVKPSASVKATATPKASASPKASAAATIDR